MAAASARTSRLGLCGGCSMWGKIAVVVTSLAGSMASGSSAGSLVPVASAGAALFVALIASGGTVAVSEVAGVAVPALGATFVAPATA